MSKNKADALLTHATNVLSSPEVTGTIPCRVLSECLGIAILRINKRAIVSTSKTAGTGVLVAKTQSGGMLLYPHTKNVLEACALALATDGRPWISRIGNGLLDDPHQQ